MTQLLTDIVSHDWQVKLETQKDKQSEILEALDAIKQSIYIILTTPKGSVPHNPEFGCDLWKYIDHPTDNYLPLIITEAIKAISIWETRAKISTINATINEGQVLFSITLNINDIQTEIEVQL